jgi:hypothetical protein
MPKERVDPVVDEHGNETHPAFGFIHVGRVTCNPPENLFQSDVGHHEYVELTVHEATRHRNLKQDWIHPTSVLMKLKMSMVQFASMIASGGTEGVPATLDFVATNPGSSERPGLKAEPRLALNLAEVRGAASKAFDAIWDAFAAYEEVITRKPPAKMPERREAMNNLRSAIRHAAPNVTYAAKRLNEHTEEVVEGARADLEAMIIRMAAARGIDPVELSGSQPALAEGDETV